MVFISFHYFSAKETLVRPQFIEKLKNISVKQGTLVELAVRAIGNPLPDIVWLKNSDIISPHKHPHIRHVSIRPISIYYLFPCLILLILQQTQLFCIFN